MANGRLYHRFFLIQQSFHTGPEKANVSSILPNLIIVLLRLGGAGSLRCNIKQAPDGMVEHR